MEPALKTGNVFILVKRSAANGWYVCLGTEDGGSGTREYWIHGAVRYQGE